MPDHSQQKASVSGYLSKTSNNKTTILFFIFLSWIAALANQSPQSRAFSGSNLLASAVAQALL
ncbi:MAG: hypothetical protein J5846_05355 [Desulfovibrio sp.]|nr:hypothetical protein [Desulfovibrio sp.]